MRNPGRAKVFDITPRLSPRTDSSAAPREERPGRVLEPAVDLVGEQVRAGLRGDRHEPVEGRAVDVRPGRVVREVDHDRAGVRAQCAAHVVEVQRPAALVLELDGADLRARGARDLVQRLVGGRDDDGVVVGAQRGLGEGEDRLLRAREDEHVVRLEPRIQRCDLGAQQRVPGGLGVSERQLLPQRARLVVGQRQQLALRVGLDVGGAQQELGGELVLGEVALQRERADRHRPSELTARVGAHG